MLFLISSYPPVVFATTLPLRKTQSLLSVKLKAKVIDVARNKAAK